MQGCHLPAVLHCYQQSITASQPKALQAPSGALDIDEPVFIGFLQRTVTDRHGVRPAFNGSEETASEIEHYCYTPLFVWRWAATSSTAWTMPV
ncbi:hypothetical protein D3C71_1867430 [compost metagenome]